MGSGLAPEQSRSIWGLEGVTCPQEAGLGEPETVGVGARGPLALLHLVKGRCSHIPGPPQQYLRLGLWLGPCPLSEAEYISGTLGSQSQKPAAGWEGLQKLSALLLAPIGASLSSHPKYSHAEQPLKLQLHNSREKEL